MNLHPELRWCVNLLDYSLGAKAEFHFDAFDERAEARTLQVVSYKRQMSNSRS